MRASWRAVVVVVGIIMHRWLRTATGHAGEARVHRVVFFVREAKFLRQPNKNIHIGPERTGRLDDRLEKGDRFRKEFFQGFPVDEPP